MEKWFSVKDKLPDENQGKVIVYGANKRYYYASKNLIYSDPNGAIRIPANYGKGVEITHWMPLPEPPESENAAE